jgi:hypothetical protein
MAPAAIGQNGDSPTRATLAGLIQAVPCTTFLLGLRLQRFLEAHRAAWSRLGTSIFLKMLYRWVFTVWELM